MSNEITYNSTLTWFKSSIMAAALGRSVNAKLVNMTGTLFTEGSILVGTGGTAFPLGQVTQPHWCWFANMDATNYFTLQNGGGGAIVCRFLAGEADWVPLDPTCVPFGVANTASVQVEYVLLSL